MNKSQKTAPPESAKKQHGAATEERDKKQWCSEMDQEREPICYPANENNEDKKRW